MSSAGRADIDRHVRVELFGIELAESVLSEARRIVDQQAHRRKPLRRGEDASRRNPRPRGRRRP